MKDLGVAKSCFGFNITIDKENRTVSLDQKGYILKLLEKFETPNSYPVSTPMEPGSIFSAPKPNVWKKNENLENIPLEH